AGSRPLTPAARSSAPTSTSSAHRRRDRGRRGCFANRRSSSCRLGNPVPPGSTAPDAEYTAETMRAVLAAAVAALAVAAPAAAVTVPKSVSSALRVPSPVAVAEAAKSDKLHSCQAGDRRPRTAETSAGQTERKAAVVACEQPPRSNLLTPDSVAKATAAALSVLG